MLAESAIEDDTVRTSLPYELAPGRQPKRQRNLTLKDSTWQRLKEISSEYGISRSEFIDRLIEGLKP